jgi:hypothetical protein
MSHPPQSHLLARPSILPSTPGAQRQALVSNSLRGGRIQDCRAVSGLLIMRARSAFLREVLLALILIAAIGVVLSLELRF